MGFHNGISPLNLVCRDDSFISFIRLNTAAADPDDPVRHRCDRLIVRDDHDGRMAFAAQPVEQLQNSFACLVVKGAGRLVAEQKLRILCQGTRDGDALLLSAG